MNGYTYGLESFGKEEMEVLGIDAKPSDLRDFLASLVSYVLENDVELHDGRPSVLMQMISTPSSAAQASDCRRSR